MKPVEAERDQALEEDDSSNLDVAIMAITGLVLVLSVNYGNQPDWVNYSIPILGYVAYKVIHAYRCAHALCSE